MLANYTITAGYWKKISVAGQTGTAWLKSANGFRPNIKIAHTSSVQSPTDNIPVASAVDLDVDIAYSLPKHRISDELVQDDSNDIFYATLINTGKTCIITVDFDTI